MAEAYVHGPFSGVSISDIRVVTFYQEMDARLPLKENASASQMNIEETVCFGICDEPSFLAKGIVCNGAADDAGNFIAAQLGPPLEIETRLFQTQLKQ